MIEAHYRKKTFLCINILNKLNKHQNQPKTEAPIELVTSPPPVPVPLMLPGPVPFKPTVPGKKPPKLLNWAVAGIAVVKVLELEELKNTREVEEVKELKDAEVVMICLTSSAP